MLAISILVGCCIALLILLSQERSRNRPVVRIEIPTTPMTPPRQEPVLT